MFKHTLFFVLLLIGLDVFSQGANLNEHEVISRVYFGTLPYDATDIMSPPNGTNLLPCTGYSDYSLGNTNIFDGNDLGLEYFTGVLRNETYELEVEGDFCDSDPSIFNANRSIKVYIDYDASGTFEATELVYTSPYYNVSNPIINAPITIPNNAALGSITMRIIYNRVGISTPIWELDLINWSTNNFQYGETEDYTLVVTGYVDSIQSVNTSCYNSSDGQIQIFPNVTAPVTTEYSINGLAGPWSTNLIYTNLSAGDYDVWARDTSLAPNIVYEKLQTSVVSPDTLFVNPQIISDYNGSHLSCFGASDAVLNVNATGGTPPYYYSLVPDPTVSPLPANNLIINLSAGLQTLQLEDDNGCLSSPQPFEVIQPDELLISDINLVSNVSCFGGSDGEVIISASGGTGAYSYFVDSLYNSSNQAQYSVNGLAANTYNVVVSDLNNCTSSIAILPITQPNQLNANLTFVNLGCEGDFGSATVSPTGGTPNYLISWTNGTSTTSIDQLTSGAYSVSITDALGCQEIIDFEITEPSISLLVTPIVCNGSNNGVIAATLNNSNPSSVYSVLWDDVNAQTTYTAIGLSAGDYSVTMTDQFGCELIASASIAEVDSLNIFVEHTQLCPDNPIATALVFASGGLTPYDYLWSTNETSELIYIQNPGTYSVQVTDYNNCQQDVEIAIDSINPIQLDFVAQAVSCVDNNDGSVEVFPTGGYSPYTYFWSNYTEEALNSEAQSGFYAVTVTDKNGCEYYQETEVPSSDQSCIIAYSAFSPNGDQNNDYWHIDNIELYPDALVEVFNRWGDRVYSTKKYINTWEVAWQGMYENNPLPSATYYYVITLNNYEEPIAGTVTIVR